MSNNAMMQIHDFHSKFGLAYIGTRRTLPDEMADLRVKRLHEEATELLTATTLEDLCDAVVDLCYIAIGTLYLHGYCNRIELQDSKSDLPDVAREYDAATTLANMALEVDRADAPQELVTLIYLANRWAYHSGIPLAELFDEVHAANMRKERGNATTSKYGNTYDIVKPAGWVGPNLKKILKAHGFNPYLMVK